MKLITFYVFVYFFVRSSYAFENSNRISADQSSASSQYVEYETRNLWETNHWAFRLDAILKNQFKKDEWERASLIEPSQIYIENRYDYLSIKLGSVTPVFEGTDALNPMDIATVKDSSDILKMSSRASWGILSNILMGSVFELDLLYIPSQTMALLPGIESKWWPRSTKLPLSTDSQILQLPEKVEYKMGSTTVRNNADKNNYGVRLQSHTDFGEFALAYFEGQSQTPLLKPKISGNVIDVTGGVETILMFSPIEINSIYYKRRTVSGLMILTLGEYILKVASRYDEPVPEDADVKGKTQQSVFGIERTWNSTNHMWTILLQGISSTQTQSSGIISVTDELNQSGMLGIRWSAYERYVMTLGGFYNQKKKSHLVDFNQNFKFTDRLNLDFYAQVLGGSSTSLLGILDDRDRVGIKLNLLF